MKPPIYLDHAATTPLDPRVLAAMQPWLEADFGNAASRQHVLGRRAAAAVDAARAGLAAELEADPREIVFTSGATEANNLALFGVARAAAHAARPRHVVSARTEHHAVLDPLAALEAEGMRVSLLDVDADGHVDLERLESLLREGVLLVTLMHANNETGVLHPVAEIGALCRAHGALLHTDATAAFGKERLSTAELEVDLVSLSAHKLYGPKGVGALYVRRRRPRVRCAPLLLGGGHEGGMRSGTLNVPGIVGFAAAAELCGTERTSEQARLLALRHGFEAELARVVGGVRSNGDPVRRLAGVTNVSFEGVEAESLLARLERVCASSSAACTSAARQPSHVLRAMGCDAARLAGSVRFALGRATRWEELGEAVEELARAVAAERREGPRPACIG